MKKFVTLILVLVCVFSLVACENVAKNSPETHKEIKSITNTVEPDMLFPAVVQAFFYDEHYVYEFGYPVSEFIIVEYIDGTTENVCEALENGHIQITDLDTYGIQYFTRPR